MTGIPVTLSELPPRTPVIVESVDDSQPNDPIARRLRELGFVAGEEVKVVALGPLGREPLLVQVGFTRYALRRTEAARVRVTEVAVDTSDCCEAIEKSAFDAVVMPCRLSSVCCASW